MYSAESAPIERIHSKILGRDKPYSSNVQASAYTAYRFLFQKLHAEYAYLFAYSASGRRIPDIAEHWSKAMKERNVAASSLDQVFPVAEMVKTDINQYILDTNKSLARNLVTAIQAEIIPGFSDSRQKVSAIFKPTPAQKLFVSLSKCETIQSISAVWSEFKLSLNRYPESASRFRIPLPPGYQSPTLKDKITEIDILLINAITPLESLAQIVAVINEIPRLMDKHDALEAEAEENAFYSHTVETNLFHARSQLIEGEHLEVEKSKELGYWKVTASITLDDQSTTTREIKIVDGSFKGVIDNKNVFFQKMFSNVTIATLFQDMRKLEATKVIIAEEQKDDAIKPVKKDWTSLSFWEQAVSNGWNTITSFFKPKSRRAGLVAAGFAIFLGALAGKQPVQHHQTHRPTTTVATPPPVSHIHNQVDIDHDAPNTVVAETPAPVTHSNSLVVTQSTSEGSRYSLASHNHNTNETLQRLVSSMGFNSVQTKVISTRLDNQLMAARGIQAPHTHTHANQTVTLEQDSSGSQIRLSVQDASGHSLYQTGWFAKEIGFRNFTARR